MENILQDTGTIPLCAINTTNTINAINTVWGEALFHAFSHGDRSPLRCCNRTTHHISTYDICWMCNTCSPSTPKCERVNGKSRQRLGVASATVISIDSVWRGTPNGFSIDSVQWCGIRNGHLCYSVNARQPHWRVSTKNNQNKSYSNSGVHIFTLIHVVGIF